MARRSIGGPLTIGIVSMVLVLMLAVGWQILVWRGDSEIPEFPSNEKKSSNTEDIERIVIFYKDGSYKAYKN